MKSLIYDSDCGFCRSIIRWLHAMGWISANQAVAFQSLPESDQLKALEAGIQNEIIAVSLNEWQSKKGVVGLFWAMDDQPVPRKIFWFFSTLRLVTILEYSYRFVAFNRRYIAPNSQRKAIHCACDPVGGWGYRIAYGVSCLAIWGGVAGLMLLKYPNMFAIGQVVSSGLIAMGFFVNAFLKNSYELIDCFCHASSILVTGVIWIAIVILLKMTFQENLLDSVLVLVLFINLLATASSFSKRM